jgi:hypothetical protein
MGSVISISQRLEPLKQHLALSLVWSSIEMLRRAAFEDAHHVCLQQQIMAIDAGTPNVPASFRKL